MVASAPEPRRLQSVTMSGAALSEPQLRARARPASKGAADLIFAVRAFIGRAALALDDFKNRIEQTLALVNSDTFPSLTAFEAEWDDVQTALVSRLKRLDPHVTAAQQAFGLTLVGGKRGFRRPPIDHEALIDLVCALDDLAAMTELLAAHANSSAEVALRHLGETTKGLRAQLTET